jgi:hypothetical protein
MDSRVAEEILKGPFFGIEEWPFFRPEERFNAYRKTYWIYSIFASDDWLRQSR